MSKKAANLDELLDLGEAQARRTMIGTKKELLPIFHLIYPDGTSMVVGTPWSNDAEKQIAIGVVREAMIKGDVIRYSFVSEAWSVYVPQGESFEGRPKDAPNRVEMVVITACDLKRETIRALVIKRDDDGNCVDLVGTGFETSSVEGVMTSMLRP